MLKKILKYLFVTTGSLVALALIVGVGMYHNIIRIPIQLGSSHASYPADYSEPRNFMGAYHNVFIGKVIKQSGERIEYNSPRTQFSVEVLYNIKGNLSGNVVVDQTGGYFRGTLTLIENHPLLTLGTIYLFATRGNGEKGWYTLGTYPGASRVIPLDSTLPKGQIISLLAENPNIKQLEAAYLNEILDKSDIQRNTTYNAFQSLPPEAKAAARQRVLE